MISPSETNLIKYEKKLCKLGYSENQIFKKMFGASFSGIPKKDRRE